MLTIVGCWMIAASVWIILTERRTSRLIECLKSAGQMVDAIDVDVCSLRANVKLLNMEVFGENPPELDKDYEVANEND